VGFLNAAREVDGGIVSVTGGRDNPVTNGFVCPHGTGDPRRVHRGSQVLHPRIRNGLKSGNQFKVASWDEVMGEVTRRLNATLDKRGPKGVLLLDYFGNATLITSIFTAARAKELSIGDGETICFVNE
jgi:anaerobic selenocysteine-containing dehydrogenase